MGTTAAVGVLGVTLLAFKFLLPGSEPDSPKPAVSEGNVSLKEDATADEPDTSGKDDSENQQTVASSLLGMLPGGQSPDNAPSESEAQATARSNLKKLGLGMHNFHDAYGSFPLPGKTEADFRDRYVDAQGRVLLSWRVHILPYLGEANLYHQFHLDEPWDSAHNLTLLEKMPQIYAASEVGTKPGYTCIQAPCGKGTVMEGGRGCKLKDINDGTSDTVLLIRTNASLAVPWTKPADYDAAPEQAISGLYFENDVTLFLLCNSLVQTLDRRTDRVKLPDGLKVSRMAAMFTIAGREELARLTPP
jgi:hypothetical protein